MALQEELQQQGNWLFKRRSNLPLFILIVGICVYCYTETHQNVFILEDTKYEVYYEMCCLLIALFGLAIRVYTVGYTPENTSGRNTAQGQVADSLNTKGIYSIVRHPLYLGNFFMWFGVCLLTGNLWFNVSFCLFYWIYYERIMFAEEQFLRGKFGDAFTNWANCTPAFLPKFKLFIKPIIPFSLKKVLKKEKDGLCALFAIFALFNVISKFIDPKDKYNYFLLIVCGFVFVLYCVLKFLKNKTKVLDETNR